jgi:phage terminase large subunit-like protein
LREQEAAAAEGRQPRWEAFHFTSKDNPHISKDALAEISRDMTSLSYRQEIMAEDLDEVPGALWSIVQLDNRRVHDVPPLVRVAVGIDPPGGSGECGIIVAGVGRCSCKGTAETHGFVLQDRSLKGPPDRWAKEAVAAYHMFHADRIFGEKNFGGDMVEATLRTVDPSISYQSVSASRGKAVRAEPIAALYEQAKVHHVGRLDGLENEMISWQPGSSWSPNRIDALVWVLTELMTGEARYVPIFTSVDPEPRRSVFVDKPDEHWPKHFRLRRDRIEGRTLW